MTTLGLLYPNILNKTLTEGQALDFIKKYPLLLPLNYSSLVLAKHWPKASDLVSFLINRYPIDTAKDSILLLYPNIQNKTLTTEASINFMTTYPDLVKERINSDNLLYLKFYTRYPTLTDSVIKQIPYDLGISLIFNLNPFLLNNTFTENKAAYFINLYPYLARSFGSHKDFPRLVYFFTQIPKSVDAGIKTIEDFDFLVNTLNSVLRYVDEAKKDEERISFFMKRYPWLIKEYDWDEGNRRIFEFHELYPTLTDTLLRLKIKRDHVLSTIHNVRPYLKEIPEFTINDFIKSYEHLVRDDGLNATDVRLLPYYHEHRLLTDTAIKELKDLDSILFVLDSYYPYIKEGEVSSLRLRRYILEDGDLFRVKEYAHPLADPDEDCMNNIAEMKILRDLFFGVGNFSWSPTKIINDKVYEGNVYVRAKSVRGMLPTKLYWIPINYTQFPKEVQLRAFPNETIREFDLIPLDENLIEITIPIKDFKGGREYKIIALVKDRAGKVERRELITPYIREFENIAPLDDKIIGVTYYVALPDWIDTYKPEGPLHIPLLGFYPLPDKIVYSKHIDWMTGHGIDLVFISWGSRGPYHETIINNLQKFLENDLSDDIKFAIMYESTHRMSPDERGYVDMNNSTNQEILLKDIKFMARNYFNKDNYFHLGNKPVIYLYESKAWYGDVKGVVDKIRESIFNEFLKEMYLLADLAHPLADPKDPYWEPKIPAFDGFTTWAGGYLASGQYGNTYENYVEKGYKRWKDFCEREGYDLITSIVPGFDASRVRLAGPHVPLERSLSRFEERIKIALKYATLPLVRIDTFNDFGENTHIEPTVDEHFSYLQVLSKIIKFF